MEMVGANALLLTLGEPTVEAKRFCFTITLKNQGTAPLSVLRCEVIGSFDQGLYEYALSVSQELFSQALAPSQSLHVPLMLSLKKEHIRQGDSLICLHLLLQYQIGETEYYNLNGYATCKENRWRSQLTPPQQVTDPQRGFQLLKRENEAHSPLCPCQQPKL